MTTDMHGTGAGPAGGTASPDEVAELVHTAARIRAGMETVIEGKSEVVRTALTVLLAEDARPLARLLGAPHPVHAGPPAR